MVSAAVTAPSIKTPVRSWSQPCLLRFISLRGSLDFGIDGSRVVLIPTVLPPPEHNLLPRRPLRARCPPCLHGERRSSRSTGSTSSDRGHGDAVDLAEDQSCADDPAAPSHGPTFAAGVPGRGSGWSRPGRTRTPRRPESGDVEEVEGEEDCGHLRLMVTVCAALGRIGLLAVDGIPPAAANPRAAGRCPARLRFPLRCMVPVQASLASSRRWRLPPLL